MIIILLRKVFRSFFQKFNLLFPWGASERLPPAFNGAASLMDAETAATATALAANGALQWGRITNGCGNIISVFHAATPALLQWGHITDGCGN